MRKGDFCSIHEAAQMLKVADSTIRKRLNSGELKGTKIGSVWRIRGSDLDEFVAKGERAWEIRKAEADREKRLSEIDAHRAAQKAAKERLKEARKRRKPSPAESGGDMETELLRAAMASALGRDNRAGRPATAAARLIDNASLSFDGQTMRIGVESGAGCTARNIGLIRNREAVLLAALFDAGVDNPRLRVGSKDALDMGKGLFLGEQGGNATKPRFFLLENYIKDGFALYARLPRRAGGLCAKDNLAYKDWRMKTSRFCSIEDAAVRSRDDLSEALRNGAQTFSVFPAAEGLVCLSVSREGSGGLRKLVKKRGIPSLDLYQGAGMVYGPDGSALFFFKDRGDVAIYRDRLVPGVRVCGRGAINSAVAAGSFLGGLWEGGVSKSLIGELPASLKGLATAISEPAAADRPL